MVRLDVSVKPRRSIVQSYPPGLAGGNQQVEIAVNRGQAYPRNTVSDRFVQSVCGRVGLALAKDCERVIRTPQCFDCPLFITILVTNTRLGRSKVATAVGKNSEEERAGARGRRKERLEDGLLIPRWAGDTGLLHWLCECGEDNKAIKKSPAAGHATGLLWLNRLAGIWQADLFVSAFAISACAARAFLFSAARCCL